MAIEASRLQGSPYDTPALRVTQMGLGISMEQARELVLRYLIEREECAVLGHDSNAYWCGYLKSGEAEDILEWDNDDARLDDVADVIEASVEGVESFHPAECVVHGVTSEIRDMVRQHAAEWFGHGAEQINDEENLRLDEAMAGMGIPSLAGTHTVVHTTAEELQSVATGE